MKKSMLTKSSIIAVCLCLVSCANTLKGIPLVDIQDPTDMPLYYGSRLSVEPASSSDINPTGLSVFAELVEALTDTYTFFDDWEQQEYIILRMKTDKLIKGTEMTDEFYYLIPVEFTTDYSLYDKFAMVDMAQLGYENSVMYNKTEGHAESLELVLFGYSNFAYHTAGANFIAYDSNGNFDGRLWESNQEWRDATQGSYKYAAKTLAELEERQKSSSEDYVMGVKTLKLFEGEAADAVNQIASFDNGIFVNGFSSTLLYLSSPSICATRHIGGFATNEYIKICSEQNTVSHSVARFDQNDMQCLPDLRSAMVSVSDAYNAGTLTPPNIKNHTNLRLLSHGIFGWYAKTENGVLGVVRVTWKYESKEKSLDYYDDAYYIIEYGEDECKPVYRNALLKKIGKYEKTYIYDGIYNNGKGEATK